MAGQNSGVVTGKIKQSENPQRHGNVFPQYWTRAGFTQCRFIRSDAIGQRYDDRSPVVWPALLRSMRRMTAHSSPYEPSFGPRGLVAQITWGSQFWLDPANVAYRRVKDELNMTRSALLSHVAVNIAALSGKRLSTARF